MELRVLLAGAARQNAIQVKLDGVLLAASSAEGGCWRAFEPIPRHLVFGANLISLRRNAKRAQVGVRHR
jgi:hypothetical protein